LVVDAEDIVMNEHRPPVCERASPCR
jgi:hypothetical protein